MCFTENTSMLHSGKHDGESGRRYGEVRIIWTKAKAKFDKLDSDLRTTDDSAI